jgi:hypothetical protein
LGTPTQLYDYNTNPVLLDAVRNSDNLVVSLTAAIPDFEPTAQLIRTGTVSPSYFQRIYVIMHDGMVVEPNLVLNIPTASISQIEIYKNVAGNMSDPMKSADPGSVIAICTERFVPVPPNFYHYQLRGFDRPSIFKEPNPAIPTGDYRSTVYWNPSITTNDDGVAHFDFHTSDVSGNYRIIVEGMTSEGKPFRHQEVFKVD